MIGLRSSRLDIQLGHSGQHYGYRGSSQSSGVKLGAVMISKCFNPACSARFHSLAAGTVFRLEPDHGFKNSPVDPEYFWLCEQCDSAMTLTLREDGSVIVAQGSPPHAHGVRRNMPLAFNRSKGLLLRSISFSPRPVTTANDPY
jgi:hypothetical protein